MVGGPNATPTGRSSSAPGCDPRGPSKSWEAAQCPAAPIKWPQAGELNVCIQVPRSGVRASGSCAVLRVAARWHWTPSKLGWGGASFPTLLLRRWEASGRRGGSQRRRVPGLPERRSFWLPWAPAASQPLRAPAWSATALQQGSETSTLAREHASRSSAMASSARAGWAQTKARVGAQSHNFKIRVFCVLFYALRLYPGMDMFLTVHLASVVFPFLGKQEYIYFISSGEFSASIPGVLSVVHRICSWGKRGPPLGPLCRFVYLRFASRHLSLLPSGRASPSAPLPVPIHSLHPICQLTHPFNFQLWYLRKIASFLNLSDHW